MSAPVQWGILGAADFARNKMGPAIHAARGARLAALATRSPEKAQHFASFAPDIAVHDDYAALLADPQIEAVYVPLPNALHAEWSVRALEAGKAVLCEKPIGMDVAEIDRLIATRDRAGRLAAEAYMILHHPQWPRVRTLLADGAIGEVCHVEGVFTYDNRDAGDIRNQAEMGGGGLRDIGVYPIGAARYAMGAEPQGWTAEATWEAGVDTMVAAQANLAGARFSVRVSMRMTRWQEMTFHGTTGLIRLPAPFNASDFAPAAVQILRPGRETIEEHFPTALQYVTQVEAFGASLREDAPYPVPLEWSRGTQAALDAILATLPGPD